MSAHTRRQIAVIGYGLIGLVSLAAGIADMLAGASRPFALCGFVAAFFSGFQMRRIARLAGSEAP